MEFVRGSTLLVTAVAAVVCGGLILGLTMLSTGNTTPSSIKDPVVVATIDAPRPPAEANRQISEVTLAPRPLFHKDRRPMLGGAEDDPSFAPEPTNASHIQLKGVIRRGGTSRAYVEMIGGQPVWLKTGETLAGWTLKQVSDDGVVLTDGSQNISLALHPSLDP
ncbi:MAG: hypothetical protein WA989_06570 [Henriciella sp.]|uniref:hypothetical protein n=1 Tax=Henriciella sp. TaxID=1968823 RepID=UPI003C72FC23